MDLAVYEQYICAYPKAFSPFVSEIVVFYRQLMDKFLHQFYEQPLVDPTYSSEKDFRNISQQKISKNRGHEQHQYYVWGVKGVRKLIQDCV